MPGEFVLKSRPVLEMVDLTADSEDDDGPVTRQHGTGRVAPTATRKSGQSYVRSPKPATPIIGPSSRQSNGRSGTSESSPRRKLGSMKTSASGTQKTSESETLKSTQSRQASAIYERKQAPTKFSSLRREGPQKAPSDVVVIPDDGEDEPRKPPVFKMPRGLESQSQPTPNGPSRESLSGISKGQMKRQRDSDSQDSGAAPAKRQRLTQSFDDHRSMASKDGSSRSSLGANMKIKSGLARDDHTDNNNGIRSRGNGSSSPLHNARDTRSVEQRAGRGVSPKRASHASTIPRRALPSDNEPQISRRRRDSVGTGVSASQNQSATPHKPGNEDDDDDTHSSSASGGHSSRRDTTPRIRKETAKAQALSAERKSKSQSGADAQSPSGQARPANPRPLNQNQITSSTNESMGTSADGRASAFITHQDGRAEQRTGHSRLSEAAKKSTISKESKLGPSTASKAKESLDALKDGKLTDAADKSLSDSAVNGHGSQTKGKVPFTKDVESVLDANDVPSESDSSPPRARRRERGQATRSRGAALESSSDGILSPAAAAKAKSSEATAERTSSSKTNTADKTANAMAEEADLQLRSEAMKGDDQISVTNELKNSFVVPTMAASAMKQSSSYSRTLPLGAQVEKILGKYLEELGDDNEYWTSVSLARARLSKESFENLQASPNSVHGSGHEEKPTSFAKLRPLGWSINSKGATSAKSDRLWGIERMSTTGRGAGPTWLSAEYTTFESDVPDVPSYAHYVSIKNNILAPNVTKLICWPYFGDEVELNYHTNLHEQYHLDIDDRQRKLVLLLKAQKYEEYVQSALEDLGCSWADVLRFLLEDEPDVGTSQDAMKAASNRDDLLDNDFSRISERWRSILADLPASSPDKLGRVAVLCDNFQKLAKFSLWHVARRSEFAKLPEEDNDDSQKALPSDNQLTCRICLRFNCPYHGELREQENSESDADSDSVVDSVVATDIIHPPRVNYRTRVAIPPAYTLTKESGEANANRNDKKDPRFWRRDDFNHLPDERGPFYPCHHPGTSCADAQCSCFENKIPCEKICSCAPDCHRKFQGCSCTTARFKKGSRGPCFEDERCACYQSGRECDPDLCGDCGACEVVDPVNKDDDSILAGRCRNCSIQRGVPKQTLLGDSGVHGLGLYACEDIREHDFVGEYKGEIITKEEAERRGAVYEIQKLSYLFSLNATQEIDSTNFGNKVRFINHAKVKANLYPRIIMVNTVHRIALYASAFIRPGQELLFDYGPKFPDDQLGGGKKSKKSAPHVRNAELTKTFYEVEESEDEAGNVRAKAVAHGSRARNKSKIKKARGGARPNAGRKPRVRKVYDEGTSAGAFTEQDAGERLAAFNISDEVRSDVMDLDVDLDGDEDDEYEDEEGFESEESYATDPSVNPDSEDDDEDAEDDEDLPAGVGGQNRGGGASRRRFR